MCALLCVPFYVCPSRSAIYKMSSMHAVQTSWYLQTASWKIGALKKDELGQINLFVKWLFLLLIDLMVIWAVRARLVRILLRNASRLHVAYFSTVYDEFVFLKYLLSSKVTTFVAVALKHLLLRCHRFGVWNLWNFNITGLGWPMGPNDLLITIRYRATFSRIAPFSYEMMTDHLGLKAFFDIKKIVTLTSSPGTGGTCWPFLFPLMRNPPEGGKKLMNLVYWLHFYLDFEPFPSEGYLSYQYLLRPVSRLS
jgi:hypothetical protein